MTQKQQEAAYKEKYGNTPIEKEDRLNFIISNAKSKEKIIESVKQEVARIKKIKWKKVSYTIYLIPKATPRPRSSSRGFFYVSGAADNKKFFKKFYKENINTPMIKTPCKFYCDSYLPFTSDMNITTQLLAELGFMRPIKKPDFDNLAKTYSDMIQGVLLMDDSLIIEGVSRKWYSCKPRIEITIKYMESFDSNYNEKRIFKLENKKG
jgi:Holliday junction resolvase RusA-like endonuclease